MLEIKGFEKYNDVYAKYNKEKYINMVKDIIAVKICKKSQATFIDKYNKRRSHASRNFKNLYGEKLGVDMGSDWGVYVSIKNNKMNFTKYSFSTIDCGIIAE